MRALFIFIAFLAGTSGTFAQREILDFNQGWKFHLGHSFDIDKDFGFGILNA